MKERSYMQKYYELNREYIKKSRLEYSTGAIYERLTNWQKEAIEKAWEGRCK